MHKLWEHSFWYSFCRIYVDLCTKRSFTHLTIEGDVKVPKDAAVIYAPNHCCTLMDPLVLLCARRGPSAFGARADMFNNPTANQVLRWLRIVPLVRARDGLSEVKKNFSTFDEIVECMDNQVPFYIFSEGTHRPRRNIQRPLKKGIFRISEMAAEKTGRPVYIVPVGINYDDFFRYMKGCHVRFGEPISLDTFNEMGPIQREQLLGDSMQALVDTEDPVRKTGHIIPRILLSIASLPVLVACAAICSPVLLVTLILTRKVKDRAWWNSIRYSCSLLFFFIWPFHSLFYMILNLYDNLIKDIKKK